MFNINYFYVHKQNGSQNANITNTFVQNIKLINMEIQIGTKTSRNLIQ